MQAELPPDEHEIGCETCQEARDRYERLGEVLAELPPIKAPAGWERRVLEALPENEPAQPRVAWLPWAFGLAAAALVAFVVWQLNRPVVGQLAVRQEVIATAAGRRADSAAVGDTIRISTRGGAGEVRELRLYRDMRELVARCPGDAGCKVVEGSPELTIALKVPGSYRSLIIVGPTKAPEPTGVLDEDARAASAAGASVEMSRAVDVE
jgi:hypothetical protein